MNFFTTHVGRLGAFILILLVTSQGGMAQDSPASMLSLAKKQAALAKGQPQLEASAALKKAIALYEQVPEKWPEAASENAKSFLGAAVIDRKLGNSESALKRLATGLKTDAQPAILADLYMTKASIHRRLKQLDQATATLKELLERCSSESKDCAKARLVLGSIARRQKRYVDAMQQARDVLEKHEDAWRENVDAIQLFLSILIKCHRWDEAKKELATLEQQILVRFAGSKKLDSIKKALARLPARRMLTPLPIVNND